MNLPLCDCCLRPIDRMWAYRHRGFCYEVLGGREAYLAGWWGFCVYCHALFVARDFPALAARVCSLLKTEDAHAEFETLYRLADAVIYGEPVLWQEGEDRSEKRFPLPEVKI